MATLLHFLRSLLVALLTGFLLVLMALCVLLGFFMAADRSPMAQVFAPLYRQVSSFLSVFGGGDRLEGIVAIALSIGIVTALLSGLGRYKRWQRSQWHLATSNFRKD